MIRSPNLVIDGVLASGSGTSAERSSSPVGDVWFERVGALGEGKVDEVDAGGPEENVGGLEVVVTPSPGRGVQPTGP